VSTIQHTCIQQSTPSEHGKLRQLTTELAKLREEVAMQKKTEQQPQQQQVTEKEEALVKEMAQLRLQLSAAKENASKNGPVQMVWGVKSSAACRVTQSALRGPIIPADDVATVTTNLL
jgi:hypothetical protein